MIAINRFYWPDEAATGQLLRDVCEHIADTGVEVEVITGRNSYFDPDERYPARDEHRGAKIRRVWSTMLGHRSLWGRAIDYLTFLLSACALLLFRARSGDIILAKTDPPLFSVPAGAIAWLRGARLIIWSHDVFPEVAGALGMRWLTGPLSGVLAWLRDRSVAAARPTVTISEGMADHLTSRGADPHNLAVIHNWSVCEHPPTAPETNSLRDEWDLRDRFVISYSGNLGRSHCCENIIRLIDQTGDIPGLTWLFVGGGSGIPALTAFAQDSKCDIRFKSYQPIDRLHESLSVANCHLVTLEPSCSGLIMPSKLYGAMSAARPIISLSGSTSELTTFVQTNQIGTALDITAPMEWREALMPMLDTDKARCAGQRAYDLYQRAYKRETALCKWGRIISSEETEAIIGLNHDPQLSAVRS